MSGSVRRVLQGQTGSQTPSFWDLNSKNINIGFFDLDIADNEHMDFQHTWTGFIETILRRPYSGHFN